MNYIPSLTELVISKVASYAMDKVVEKTINYFEDPIKKEYRNLHHMSDVESAIESENEFIIVSII